MLRNAKNNIAQGKSTLFGYFVNDLQRYGVAEVDLEGNVISIEEESLGPKSIWQWLDCIFT